MAELPAWRRWRRRFWAGMARGVLAAADSWPVNLHRGLCLSLAAAAPVLSPRAARRAWINLALAFPGRDVWWRWHVWRGLAPALGRNLHAALTCRRQARLGFPQVVAEAGPHGRDLLATLDEVRARGQGAFLLTGHLGCWELLGAWLAGHLDGLAVVTATVHNPDVDRLLQNRRRELGLEPLPREAGARPILRTLMAGRTVGVLLDQATRAHGAPLPFFGRPAPTPLGVARLARRRATPLVPAALVWDDGCWRVRCLPPLEPERFASDEDLARACNEALEIMITRNPDQWVWFHRRWPEVRET